MTIFDDILKQFPPNIQAKVREIWEALGPEEKASFQTLLVGFPSDAGLVKILVKLSTAQIRQAFGNKHRVVIVGPTNVGKSTLYNQLVKNKRDQAVVSPLPGTTTENQLADAALFTVVDTPGADAVGNAGEQQKDLALSAAADADLPPSPQKRAPSLIRQARSQPGVTPGTKALRRRIRVGQAEGRYYRSGPWP